jgi:transposase
MTPRYTIKDFNKLFTTDADCLAYIYAQRHPEGATCPKCGVQGHFYPVEGRRSYSCQCGSQIYPTQGTIFHKSPTSLKLWFFAMFLMTASKNGVSAKELERQLGVTYKCAWRMAHQIRQLLKEEVPTLKGTIEADETYYGGHRPMDQKHDNKTPIIGVLERGGNIIVKAVPRATGQTVVRIRANVSINAEIMTDESRVYNLLPKIGYKHQTVNHSNYEWARGRCYTSGLEGFWSQLKRSVNGTFHYVSRKHLQKYVNEFSFRYNRRKSSIPMFLHVAERVAAQHAAAV